MTDTHDELRSGIPRSDYERLENEIESADSPVGIDARKAHVLILYKLEQMEARLRAVEGGGGAVQGNGAGPGTDVVRSHADDIERFLGHAAVAEDRWPDVVAMATDVVDDEVRHLQDAGVDVEERVVALRRLALEATDPEVLDALATLAEAAPELARMAHLAEQLPDFAAMGVDVFDEAYREMEGRGIDPEAAVRQGLEAALRLSQVVSATKLEAVEALFSSTVLEPETLTLIGKMGEALVESRREPTEPVGLFGLLAASRDPDVQRAAGFLVQFARKLGSALSD